MDIRQACMAEFDNFDFGEERINTFCILCFEYEVPHIQSSVKIYWSLKAINKKSHFAVAFQKKYDRTSRYF